MPNAPSRILASMLDRLLASLTSGPSLNCRPHASRQRVDLAALSRLGDIAPEDVLKGLFSDSRSASVVARIAPPPETPGETPNDNGEKTEQQKADESTRRAFADQQSLLTKLRVVADDARTYEQDTGVHVLYVGFPLLSLPPGTFASEQGAGTRRILAPIAFVPVNLAVARGAKQAVQISCRGQGTDRVVPNVGLLAWLERQTGTPQVDLFEDEHGDDPWREVRELTAHVAKVLGLTVPEAFTEKTEEDGSQKADVGFTLDPAPRADDENGKGRIVTSAVVGLFPMANQGLLRDMQAMAEGEPLVGPVQSFVRVDVSLDHAPMKDPSLAAAPAEKSPRTFADERLAAPADPCQARAVKLARDCKGLVIHGPPGTGKSQTITNIIADHLCRGQRVLVVCDKRTALDVVMNRLEHMGLSQLAAVVHDPQRDQRDLYRSIREQLEALPEAASKSTAEQQLVRIDTELHKLHGELTAYRAALMDAPAAGASFHELVGQWLALSDGEAAPANPAAPAPLGHDTGATPAPATFDPTSLSAITIDELDHHSLDLDQTLARAQSIHYATNPWTSATGVSLSDFLARPMDAVRSAVGATVDAAKSADAANDPSIPAFSPAIDLAAQASVRSALASSLQHLLKTAAREVLANWAEASVDALRRARQKIAEAAPHVQSLREGPLDTELAILSRSNPHPLFALVSQRLSLEEYLACAGKWYGFLCLRRKSAAKAALAKYGLALSIENAQRVVKFVGGLRARMLLNALVRELMPAPIATEAQQATSASGGSAVATAPQSPPADLSDAQLDKTIADHTAALDLLTKVHSTPELESLADAVSSALTDESAAAALLDGLHRSPARAAALAKLEQILDATKLLAPQWLSAFNAAHRLGAAAGTDVSSLADHLPTFEGVLRVREGLAALPLVLRGAAQQLTEQRETAAETMATIRRAVLAGEITRRLKAQPLLQSLDAHKLKSMFDRYRQLDDQKKTLVRDAIVHRWMSVQKERLLAGTGSRLNSAGADLRRRLTLRGEHAMRLRQVVAVGQNIDGGDPLFDMRPAWLASPETVAQVFPRRTMFDVIIFDEASQCRLEEALPVLTRGSRVVISGDPKQLPPTRFFESAIATSEDDDAIDSEQALFEVHQGEVEDLLTAALSLEIQQSYLDVHYRSRNGDLIEFSNEHFYGSRLQAIPGHPSRREKLPPLRLYAVGGIYEKRCNQTEARRVGELVKELLSEKNPPSIGIACFNLQQRDLITDTLDEMAEADEKFAAKLAEARERQGAASFEGLFVKNLENVQGDERDHIIISTTYGPDAKGRFYRRFGPLGRAGGGRRLNVLVTRARQRVHLVTSIPAQEYRALPPIPPGQQPTGGWLLFSYLAYAEDLAKLYENEQPQTPTDAPRPANVKAHPTRTPSSFAAALADQIARHHNVGSDTPWGNDGFCIDIALHHPKDHEEVTIGVLCDAARYDKADDPVEWDIFRTAIHEQQGWRLHRLWTPHFFRDPAGSTQAVLNEMVEMMRDARCVIRGA